MFWILLKMDRKKKIIIDLDVVTVGKWDRSREGDLSRKFMDRVAKREFYLITPTLLIELVGKWKHVQLKDFIEDFYLKISDHILSNEDLDTKIDSAGIDDKKILGELISYGIKDEDALLVLISSIFNVDYLITFNRLHLRNNKEKINQILEKNGLKTININGPEEV